MYGKRVRVLLAAAAAMLGSGAATACGGGDGGTDPGPTTGSVVAQVSAAGSGVQGATVAISGGSADRTTAAGGEARFDGLQPGSYTLTLQQLPAGFGMGSETAGKSAAVTAGGTASVSWTVQAGTGGQAVVRAQGVSFSPSTVTIPAGGTVRFEWGSGAHTVTPENPAGSWTERTLASAADDFSVTFTTPGTYRYRCRPHSTDFSTGMVGVITVT